MDEKKNTKLNKEQKKKGITLKQALGIGAAVTAVVTTGIGVWVYLGKKKAKDSKLQIPEDFKTAVISDIWKEGDDILCIAEDISIKDLGKFGEELVEKIPGMKDMDSAIVAPIELYKFNLDLAGEGAKEVFEDMHK